MEPHRHVECSAPERRPALLGATTSLPFHYNDGWFFSVGAEYQWNDRLTVRAGIGYEISPVTDDVRMPLLPDNDRMWFSVGATWQVCKTLHFDFAYSHLFVQDTSINITPARAIRGSTERSPMSAT